MTVGELKAALADAQDDWRVGISDDGKYREFKEPVRIEPSIILQPEIRPSFFVVFPQIDNK